MKKVLVVDDEPSILTLLTFNLEKEGYQVTTSEDGKNGFELALSNQYDFIILDVMLPGMDGLEITKALRREKIDTPILILTAKDEQVDKIIGLEIGADDYLTKPFYLDELKARIQALLKRTGKLEDSNGLSYGNIRLNLSNKSTLVDDQPVDLIGKEFDLVVYLMQNQNVILPKEQIFDRIWGYDSDTTVTVVEVYMSKIRKKLKDTEFVNNLSTLRNVGYILR